MSLIDRSLSELARGLRAGELSASALLREAEERLEASEGVLGAYKLRAGDLASDAARAADAAFRAGKDAGLFQGIPVAVKDIYGVPGLPIFAGSSRELPPKWRSAGPVVACLLDEGVVVPGKTHTVEFAFGALGVNNHWPTPRNPWDARAHRVPGGSSSGAGVALCQGSCVVALGTDTAGSVRIPAALTGTVGYKPTIGRWPTEGIVPLSPWQDSPGILARSVEDAVLAAVELDRRLGRPHEPAASPQALRIGVPEDFFFQDCDPGIAEGVRSALAELERAGHHLVHVDFPEAREAFEIFMSGGTAGAELLAFLRFELPDWVEQLDPNIGTRMHAAAEISGVELLGRKMRLDALARRAGERFAGLDVIATPTTVQTPPTLGQLASWDEYRPRNLRMTRNTGTANLLQFTALTMPVALDAAGMPVGLQLMAGRGRDELLLAAGLACERTLGTGRQRLGSPALARS